MPALHTLDGKTGMNRLMVGPDYEQLRDNLTTSSTARICASRPRMSASPC
jgi:hypothetical protein